MMHRDNEFILAMLHQTNSKAFKNALEFVNPEWLSLTAPRKILVGLRGLAAKGMSMPHETDSLFAVFNGFGLTDFESDSFIENILPDAEVLDSPNVDLIKLAQYLKSINDKKRFDQVVLPLVNQECIDPKELISVVRELALISSTLGQKRLEITRSSDVIAKLESGSPLLPPDMTTNLVTFGVYALDDMIRCGPGSLGVIAATTGIGKTTMAIQAACKTALQGRNTLMVSLEMSREEINAKVWGHLLKVDSHLILSNTVKRNISNEIKDASTRVLPCCPGSGQNWDELEARIRAEHEDGKFSVVIVDYFTLLEPPDTKRGANTAQLYGEISKAAKRLAQDLGLCVILVSQFNRNAEDGEKPRMKDLRETGQLEQDANWIVMLWGSKTIPNENELPEVNGVIAKNRGGRGGIEFRVGADRMTGHFIGCAL